MSPVRQECFSVSLFHYFLELGQWGQLGGSWRASTLILLYSINFKVVKH